MYTTQLYMRLSNRLREPIKNPHQRTWHLFVARQRLLQTAVCNVASRTETLKTTVYLYTLVF